jgi:uncharacterized protein
VTIIQVKVKTNARQSTLSEKDGFWQATLKSLPVDGKANQELIALVAKAFACPKASVSIKSGATSKIKRVEISD